MTWQIYKKDIPYLVVGSRFLGCGGAGSNGDTMLTGMILESIMGEKDFITVYYFSQLTSEFVVPLAMMGSPLLYCEDIPSGEEGLQTLELFEEVSGRRADALIAVEGVGLNALSPLITAYQKKLPVVDGDGMGRAFPELHMTAFHLMGIPIPPLVLLNHRNQLKIFQKENQEDTALLNNLTARQAREWIGEQGGIASIACYSGFANRIKTALIPGTLQLIYHLGKVVHSKETKQQKLARMSSLLVNSVYGHPRLLLMGRVETFNPGFSRGVMEGEILVQGQENFRGKELTLLFRNEYLAAYQDGTPLVTAPDLILLLQEEDLCPVSVDEVQTGMPVIVCAIPAPNTIRTRDALPLFGPEAFDLNCEYKPLIAAGGMF